MVSVSFERLNVCLWVYSYYICLYMTFTSVNLRNMMSVHLSTPVYVFVCFFVCISMFERRGVWMST